MAAQVVRVDALRTLAFGSISGTYTPLGTAFAHSMRLIKLTNTTNVGLTFSFDGVTNNLFIPAGAFTLFDLTTNKTSPTVTFVFQIGTQVFVMGAPTSGAVYLECIYGQGE
jgi:hypothetical protein